MTIVNCDRAVAFYDRTRAYRAGLAERYRDAICALGETYTESRLLEQDCQMPDKIVGQQMTVRAIAARWKD